MIVILVVLSTSTVYIVCILNNFYKNRKKLCELHDF